MIRRIVGRLLRSEDYRTEVIALINAEFLEYAIEFFGRVVDAKLKNQSVTADWYKAEFLDARLRSDDLIIHSGLNKKTIYDIYHSTRREIVLEVTQEHYTQLYEAISSLVDQDNEIDVTLTIKFRGVSVDLTIGESLIVINTLAVKRAELRGGAWSTTGKRVEKILMLTLCKLYRIPRGNYNLTGLTKSKREVDFFLVSNDGKKSNCEVKLMGKGNPESADATIARASEIFVADKLSDLNKKQLSELGINWVELRARNGYKKFGEILRALDIPHIEYTGDIDGEIDRVLDEAFQEYDAVANQGKPRRKSPPHR